MAEAFEIRAKAKGLPVSPQKARRVVNAIRGMSAEEARATLRFLPHKSAEYVYKVLESAIANAEENYGLDADELYVYRIFADDGPRNRLRPYGGRFGARGRFKPIINRTAHITVILAEREASDFDVDEYEAVEETDAAQDDASSEDGEE